MLITHHGTVPPATDDGLPPGLLRFIKNLPPHPSFGAIVKYELASVASRDGKYASPSMEPKAFAVSNGQQKRAPSVQFERIVPESMLPTRFVAASKRWPFKSGYIVVLSEPTEVTLFAQAKPTPGAVDHIPARMPCTSLEILCGDPEGTELPAILASLKKAFGKPLSDVRHRTPDEEERILTWKFSGGRRVSYDSFSGLHVEFLKE